MDHKNHIMHKEKEIKSSSHNYTEHSKNGLKKEVEYLSVNCGCDFEAKQYEYNLHKTEHSQHNHKENEKSKKKKQKKKKKKTKKKKNNYKKTYRIHLLMTFLCHILIMSMYID